MLWHLIIFLCLGITESVAQDEDLNVLEATISEDSLKSPPTKRRWNAPKKSSDLAHADSRVLDLRSVLEEAFRRNPFENIRRQQKEQLELRKSDLFQSFWLPNVALELQSSNHRIDRFRESSESTPGMGAQQPQQEAWD